MACCCVDDLFWFCVVVVCFVRVALCDLILVQVFGLLCVVLADVICCVGLLFAVVL